MKTDNPKLKNLLKDLDARNKELKDPYAEIIVKRVINSNVKKLKKEYHEGAVIFSNKGLTIGGTKVFD